MCRAASAPGTRRRCRPWTRNWCSRKANTGRPVPGSMAAIPASRTLRRCAAADARVDARSPRPGRAAASASVSGRLPDQAARSSSAAQAERRSRPRRPAGRSIRTSYAIVRGVRRGPPAAARSASGDDGLGAWRATQRLADDVLAARSARRRAGWPRSATCSLPLLRRALAGHRGAGADALELVGAEHARGAGGPAWRRRRPAGRGRCAARRAPGSAAPAPPGSAARSFGRRG